MITQDRQRFIGDALSQGYRREQAQRLAQLVYPEPAESVPPVTFHAPAPPPAPQQPPSNAKIRAWAEEYNITVPARGRIPRTVTDEYQRAH